MSNSLALIRSLIIYGLCLPLAIFLGYLLAMPMDQVSFTIVLVALFLPLIPVLLRWHHWLLILSWNLSAVLFFIPGRPYLWMLMAGVSLSLSILQHILNRNFVFLYVPSVVLPLVFLALVTLMTAKLTGGFGMQSLGGESYGGKRYFLLLGAILGYFALTCHRVPPERAVLAVALFLLSGLTAAIANVGPLLNPNLYYIFLIFPVENIQSLLGEGAIAPDLSTRLGGLTVASLAILSFLLARHGLRGVFGSEGNWSFLPLRFRDGLAINQPWRLMVFGMALWICLLGGYRGNVIFLTFVFLGQFYYEGLFRTPLLPVFILVGICAVSASLPFVNKLPLNVQRSLSILPLEVDPIARASADASTEWRLQIWRNVLPTVPKYLLLGKGYAIKPGEFQALGQFAAMDSSSAGEGATLASDFHNGPLSVLIPLGIFGMIGFLWFLVGGYNVLLKNFRHGDPELRQLNIFLLCSFIARAVCFFVVFGSLYNDLLVFTGLVGLSVSINGGVRAPVVVPVEKPVFGQFNLARAKR